MKTTAGPLFSKLPLQPITLALGLSLAIGVFVIAEARAKPAMPVATAVQAPAEAPLAIPVPVPTSPRQGFIIVESEAQAAMLARQIAADQHLIYEMPGSTLANTRYSFWVIDSEEKEWALGASYAELAHVGELYGADFGIDLIDLRTR